jgi:cell wall assembly regulator SMI1
VRTWRRLVDALGADASRLGLRNGASETSIVAAETLMNARFPADYRAWLSIADGQEADSLSILPTAGWLISIDRMLLRWAEERQYDPDDEDENDDDDSEILGNGAVLPFVYHPRRITIGGTEFLDEDNTLLDLVPGPEGVSGQVITFVSESELVVLADSFDTYLDRVAELLETEQLVVAESEYGSPCLHAVAHAGRWEDLLPKKRRRSSAKKKT